jgi:Cu+-exporting ATPase
LIVGLAACNKPAATTEEGREVQAEESNVQTVTVTLPVQGMSCGACAARVKGALKKIKGVADIEVHLAERAVQVSYADGRVAPADLVLAINDLGYKASLPAEIEAELNQTTGAKSSDTPGSKSDVRSVTIPVEGMACESCVQTLEGQLKDIEGVTSVRLSLDQKKAVIQYIENKVTPERLIETIEASGFKAESPVAKEKK